MSTNEQRKAERRAGMDQGREALRAVLIRQAKEAGRTVTAVEVDGIVRQIMATRRAEIRKARAAASKVEQPWRVFTFSYNTLTPVGAEGGFIWVQGVYEDAMTAEEAARGQAIVDLYWRLRSVQAVADTLGQSTSHVRQVLRRMAEARLRART
jgi:hypothetical protein